MFDPELRREAPVDMLGPPFGPTLAEVHIACALGCGTSFNEEADIFVSSMGDCARRLAFLMTMLGVNRQSEPNALLASVAQGLREPLVKPECAVSVCHVAVFQICIIASRAEGASRTATPN